MCERERERKREREKECVREREKERERDREGDFFLLKRLLPFSDWELVFARACGVQRLDFQICEMEKKRNCNFVSFYFFLFLLF